MNQEFNNPNDVTQLFDNQNNYEVKNGTGKNVIIFILILIIIALSGVIFYLLSNDNESKCQPLVDNNQNNNIENNDEESNNVPSVEALNLDDELVKVLYTYIGGATNEYGDKETVLNFYQGKKVTTTELTLDILAQGLLNNQYSNLFIEEPLTYEKLLPIMIKMYNLPQTTKFPNKLYYSRDGGGIRCSDDKCIIEGADSVPTSPTGNLTKAEKFEDYIYLYDNYAYIQSLSPGPHCIEKMTVYTDSTMSTIAGYINNTLEKIEGSDDDCGIIDVTNDYKLTNYKHTFKKYENSEDYYWVSTEQIK